MSEPKNNHEIGPQNIYVGTLLAWVIAVVMSFLIFGPGEILRASKAFGWRKHTCEVRRWAMDEQMAKQPALLVTVAYEADGQPYEVTHRLSGHSQQELQDWAGLFLRPGDRIPCRISPNNPRELLLDREYVPFELFLFESVALAFLLAAVAILWARCARRDKAPAGILSLRIRKVGRLLLCGFVLVCCGTAMVRGFGDAILALNSLGWQKADATILVSSIRKARQGQSWGYQLDLRYTYVFHGKRYESTQWNLSDDPILMRKALRELDAGEIVPCYVNPENPSQAILQRQLWIFIGLPVLMAIVVVAGCGFWSALRTNPDATSPASQGFASTAEPSTQIGPPQSSLP